MHPVFQKKIFGIEKGQQVVPLIAWGARIALSAAVQCSSQQIYRPKRQLIRNKLIKTSINRLFGHSTRVGAAFGIERT
jgi:hypothetical protein